MRLVVRCRSAWSPVLGLLLGSALGAGAGCGGKSRQPASGAGGSIAGAAAIGGSGGPGPSAGMGGSTGGTGSSGKGGSDAGSAGTAAGTTGGAGAAGAERGGAAGGGGASGAGAPSVGAAGTAAGTAGVPGVEGRECETADDCMLASDCCGCNAVPRDGREFCALDCARDPCPEMGISNADVQCVHGRCVFGRSCDASALCLAAPPECPEGTVPSVVDDCWGPCLPPTECGNVGSCADCGDSFCVEFQAQRSSFHCVTRVQACDRENYCECLGVCGECTAADDAVACPCPVC